MNIFKAFLLLAGLLGIVLSCVPSGTPAMNVSLPSIFASNMVLQRDTDIPVWGTADPNGIVTVKIADQEKKVLSDKSGKWRVNLHAISAGEPYTMSVCGIDTIRFENVLIGEVWLCSGQSNMEWVVRNSMNAREEMDKGDSPNLRMFTVQRTVSDTLKTDCEGSWQVCTPQTVGDFSAVGYFFGRELHQELDVPVGLVHSSWGGTPAESWTSIETLKKDLDLVPIVERFDETIRNYTKLFAEYNKKVKQILDSGERLPMYHKDAGNEGYTKGWAQAEFDDNSWSEIEVPGYWENNNEMQIDGALWFRKTIQIPEAWAGKELVLTLGAIDDFDHTYFNGVEVGSTGADTPNFWVHPRKYVIPAKLVNEGSAVIAVRIFDYFGNGGFGGPGMAMKLCPKARVAAKSQFIAGQWKYKIEKELDPSSITGPGGQGLPPEPMGPGHPYSPAGLYNAMIHPLAPYAIKGAIWYQGESNADRAYQYRKLLPAMIRDWRLLWAQGDFPFGIVQLANYMAVSEDPEESAWPELREAQLLTALNDPNAGLACIIDIGEADDIHPRNKQDVGKRLALWALAKSYGKDIVYSGPLYKSMRTDGNKVILNFDHVGGGLKIKGSDELKGFAIAGDDYQFVWAKAEIKDDKVIVWADGISTPVAVRYGWANNPVCNLFNSEGLPAVPFRTDNQQGITYSIR